MTGHAVAAGRHTKQPSTYAIFVRKKTTVGRRTYGGQDRTPQLNENDMAQRLALSSIQEKEGKKVEHLKSEQKSPDISPGLHIQKGKFMR